MAGPGGREVGRVNVRVVPDTSVFTQDLLAELKAIEARVHLSIQTDLDSDHLLAETRTAVAEAERAAGKVEIKTDLDGRGALVAAQQLGRSMGGLVAAAAALGPALIPVAAGLAAVFGAVSVPLAAASIGLGAFAIVAIPSIKAVTDASKELAKAQAAVTAATTDKQRETALARQKALVDSLSPGQLAAVKSLDKLKATFGALQAALAPDIFKVFNAGLGLVTAALPAIGQLARAVAPALAGIATNLAAAFKSPELKGFVNFLASRAAAAITGFATGIGLIAKGFGSMLFAFDPLTKSITGGLHSMLESFSTIGTSNGFTNFIAYVQKTGPTVAATFGALIKTIGHLVVALAPIGAVAVGAIKKFADVINAIPVPVLTAVLAVVAALAAKVLLVAAATAVYETVMAAAEIVVGVFTAAQWLLNAALTANPIGLVVVAIAALIAGLILAYKHSDTFRAIVDAVGRALAGGFMAAIGAVVTAFHAIVGALSTVIPYIVQFGPLLLAAVLPFIGIPILIAQHWGALVGFFTDLWSSITGAVSTGISAVIGFFTALPGQVAHAIAALPGILLELVTRAGRAMLSAFEYAIAAAILVTVALPIKVGQALLKLGPTLVRLANEGWTLFLTTSTNLITRAIAFFTTLPARVGQALSTLLSTLTGAASAAWTAFRTTSANLITSFVAVVTAIPGRARAALSTLLSTVTSTAASAWASFTSATSAGIAHAIAYVAALPGRARAALSSLAGTIAGIATGAWASFTTSTSTGITGVMTLIKSIPGRITSALSGLGGLLFGAGRAIIQGLINGIDSLIGGVQGKFETLTKLIPTWKGPRQRDAVLLRPAGQLIIDGLIAGIDSKQSAVEDTLGGLTDRIRAGVGGAGQDLAGVVRTALGDDTSPIAASDLQQLERDRNARRSRELLEQLLSHFERSAERNTMSAALIGAIA